MIVHILEVRNALAASRTWMRKHANRSKEESLIPEAQVDAIVWVVEYFLNNEGKRITPEEFNEDITEGLRLMNRYDVDSIFDAIEESIDDLYDSFVTEDLYVLINDVVNTTNV